MQNDRTLPFPDRELAAAELAQDVCYPRIPPQERSALLEKVWQKGEEAARLVFAQYGGKKNFFAIARASGISCVCVEKDYLPGSRRCFSDYTAAQRQINLYLGSIRLWAQANGLPLETALDIFLSHEYFHFLESTSLGSMSREYQLPVLALGSLKLGKTGVRALSEVGAHAFARTWYELTGNRGCFT